MGSKAVHRSQLPQLAPGATFLTDSGLETDLIFHHEIELPHFAAFVLLEDPAGRATLQRYFADHVEIASRAGLGIVLETPTWRAGAAWGQLLGYPPERLDAANRAAVQLLVDVRGAASLAEPVVISGCIGPRGDGYDPGELLSPAEAERCHGPQIETFADTAADLVTAMTLTHVGEAVGIVRAATAAGLPVVISFTVETDGRLPDGTTLPAAIAEVDQATDAAAAYYLVNCAHPTHFEHVLETGGTWSARLRGVRANASRMSHADLDEATALDDGDPQELAADYSRLRAHTPSLSVLGGCCGTDARHVEAIAARCAA